MRDIVDLTRHRLERMTEGRGGQCRLLRRVNGRREFGQVLPELPLSVWLGNTDDMTEVCVYDSIDELIEAGWAVIH